MRLSRYLLLASPLLLIACSSGDVKSTFGLNRVAPDEFTVVSRPPLSVPPEFELAPPKPGATGPAQPAASDTAHAVLTGKETEPADPTALPAQPTVETAVTPVVATDEPDAATANFLTKAGADKADADIRDKLSQDNSVVHAKQGGNTLYDRVVGDKAVPEPVVDPKKETERLQDNKDKGLPANTGTVPTIDEKPKSVLDEIF